MELGYAQYTFTEELEGHASYCKQKKQTRRKKI